MAKRGGIWQKKRFNLLSTGLGSLVEEEAAWVRDPVLLGVYVAAREDPEERFRLLKEALEWRIKKRALLTGRAAPGAPKPRNPRHLDKIEGRYR